MAKRSMFQELFDAGYTMQDIREMPWERFVETVGAEPRTISVRQGGRRYACLDVAYWDPERKKPTHRRKVIGYYDEEDNLIETGSEGDTRPRTQPKPEAYARTYEVGRNLLYSSIAERIGLAEVVRRVFGEAAPMVLTCAFYMACHEGALCHCEQWSAGSDTPYGDRLGDQRISELLLRIDEDRRARFMRMWVEMLGEDDNYALDITSISSYIRAIGQVRAGYNRDGEDLEQINLALLIGSRTRLPAYYSFIPGNVNDKSSLKRFVRIVSAQGFKRFSLVTDKGFYTAENIDELYRTKMRFLVGMENRLTRAKEAIDGVRDSITDFDNFRVHGTSSVYCSTERQDWVTGGVSRRCYVHVFYDPARHEDDVRHFAEKLDKVRAGIMDGDEAYASSSMARTYLSVSRRGGKVKVAARQEKIEARNRYSGFLVLISNHVRDAEEALRIYRSKETAESAFDDLKNGMDMDRLRIHGEAAMEGKAFLAFLALILKTEVSNVIMASPSLRHVSRTEIDEEMSILRRTEIGNSAVYTERTKLQKQVIAAFGIKAPFKDVVSDPVPVEAVDHS